MYHYSFGSHSASIVPTAKLDKNTMKFLVGLAFLAVAYAGVIHDHKGHDSLGASEFHHEVEHEHAKSHQSIKLEHFHPVPVFVKKEHAHLLKHPLEKGKSEHGHKLLHPKTEHHHGYGLVLEEHRSDLEHHQGFGGEGDHGFSEHSDDVSNIEHIPEHHHELSGLGEEQHHGWEASEQVAAFDTQGLHNAEGHYQYQPIDLTHLGGHQTEEHY